jgi:hypothetical protein
MLGIRREESFSFVPGFVCEMSLRPHSEDGGKDKGGKREKHSETSPFGLLQYQWREV